MGGRVPALDHDDGGHGMRSMSGKALHAGRGLAEAEAEAPPALEAPAAEAPPAGEEALSVEGSHAAEAPSAEAEAAPAEEVPAADAPASAEAQLWPHCCLGYSRDHRSVQRLGDGGRALDAPGAVL